MPDPHTLRLSGDCGLRSIRTLRDEVSAALDETTGSLDIDCADAERIDLSFVQLIASAEKTARRAAKRLRVTNMPAAGQAAFARAGLTPPGFDQTPH